MMNPYTYYLPLQFSSYYYKTRRAVKKTAKNSLNVLKTVTGLSFLLNRKKDLIQETEEINPKRSKVLMYGVDLF